MRKETAPATTTGTVKMQDSNISKATTTKPRKPTKWAWALYYLAQRPLFALDALNLYGDTCLHSTVSDLERRFGLVFTREPVTHPHQHGGTTVFARYTLAPECRGLAAKLLKPYGLEVAA